MADRIRFYLDEHVSKAVQAGLRLHGIDVVRAQDVGLRRASDEEHLQFARQEHRVIVTQDADFLRMHRNHIEHYGIAYCDQGSRTIGEMISALVLVYQVLTVDEMRGRVEYI